MTSEIVFNRLLEIHLPKHQSAFLWGARKTGKSTYLEKHYPDAIRYDLLKTDEYLRLLKTPHLLREEILALPKEKIQNRIIIDEIQKVPLLLNEVHWLIENIKASFILCGSSARKLKKGAANLLGGRAWRYTFYPLVYAEIPDFDLLKALNHGLIPDHYLSTRYQKSLEAYLQDYLVEEIRAEGLVRNLSSFALFLDIVGFSHGELINFSNIARECGVDSKSIKEYYQILVDTMLGYFINPFHNRHKRETIVATPKFYLFDMGVANFLSKTKIIELRGNAAGKSFEHFILTELVAYRGIKEQNFDITFWRTKTGLEVDFVLNKGEIAIEVKVSPNFDTADLRGLISFQETYRPKSCYVIAPIPKARKISLGNNQFLLALPWQEFLEKLWHGDIIT